jgi:peroxiredoxin
MTRTFAATALFLLALSPGATALEPLEIGKPAPEWSLPDENGVEHKLSQYKGRAVVLEWTNSECPFVVRHYDANTMEKLASALGAKDVVWLAVNSTHSNRPEDTKSWKAEQGFTHATLQDADGALGRAYGARTTPHMFVIDGQGVLRYRGAIDDDPRGKQEQAKNYVDGAVQSLLAGASPNPSETEPYGCSVKYK